MCFIFCILKHEFTKAGLLRAANRTARYILQYFELYYSHETSSTCFVPRPLSLLYFACTHVYNLYFLVCSCVRVCVFLVVYYTESARFGPYSKRSHQSVDESKIHDVHNMSEKSLVFIFDTVLSTDN